MRNGFTLIEILVVIAIVAILASAAMPLSRMTVKRAKEIELRSNLRTLRNAIDAFRRDCVAPAPGTPGAGVPIGGTSGVNTTVSAAVKLSSEYCKADQDYYPESLEQLTEPLNLAGTLTKTKKYLRRVPPDPMTPFEAPDKPNNWGLRSYGDAPDSTSWGGGNVFDVYSKSEAVALDGSKYSTW